MRQEVHEMSVEERGLIYKKRMKEYKWVQISLSVLILITGVMAVKHFLMLNVSDEMLDTGIKVIHYLVLMMTFAAFQLVTYMGQHFFKSVPWMKEFSELRGKKDTAKWKE